MGDADMSIGSIARDEERLRLEAKSQELAQDRWKLTESAVQLGVERAELEVCSDSQFGDLLLTPL